MGKAPLEDQSPLSQPPLTDVPTRSHLPGPSPPPRPPCRQVRSEVAQHARLYRQLQKQKREVQEQEFTQLIETGQNPYEVYRRRDNEAEVAKAKERIRSNVAARSEDIALRLAREEEAYQRALRVRVWYSACICGVLHV